MTETQKMKFEKSHILIQSEVDEDTTYAFRRDGTGLDILSGEQTFTVRQELAEKFFSEALDICGMVEVFMRLKRPDMAKLMKE